MQPTTNRDRLAAALALLPAGWTFVPARRGRARVSGPDGLVIDIARAQRDNPRHLRAAADLGDLTRWLQGHPHPLVGISPASTPADIAQALTERLVPRWRAAVAAARRNRAGEGGS